MGGTANQITKDCIICGDTCTRDADTTVHVCSENCRAQYYQNMKYRKIIDNAIANNTLENLGIRISKIMSLGYTVSIVKNNSVKETTMSEPCKVMVTR